jgi:hypothetical protein
MEFDELHATHGKGLVNSIRQCVCRQRKWVVKNAVLFMDSMRLEGLPGLKQGLQAGKNAGPSIGAGSVRGVILGPLVMRHCYFGGFGLGREFDHCA